MTIVTVIGARPQFVKASVLSASFRDAGIEEYLVHTGQHYDPDLSLAFFEELGIPEPDINLSVGSGTHATQTGGIMTGLEEALSGLHAPGALLVYGDTNSTLAGALVAAKRHIPIIHVESGLRSFNRRMPEEINRIITDRLSAFLFCPTRAAVEQLEKEGMTEGVFLTGDVMFEATMRHAKDASDPFQDYADDTFAVATVHRAENTDNTGRFAEILRGLGGLDYPVLWPVHPRTRSLVATCVIPKNIHLIDPLSYRTMLSLVRRAAVVITDSGGLQKEAAWLETRCLTLRLETEWTETLSGGWNQLVGADPQRLMEADSKRPCGPAPVFGCVDGRYASDHIIEALTS